MQRSDEWQNDVGPKENLEKRLVMSTSEPDDIREPETNTDTDRMTTAEEAEAEAQRSRETKRALKTTLRSKDPRYLLKCECRAF